MSDSKDLIESVLQERRKFDPPGDFAREAHVKSFAEYQAMVEAADRDPEAFWADVAREHLDWFHPWSKVLEWEPPFAKWFVGGKLNVSWNCLDRHLGT
ncbi:MAG: acetyl-coenzyme A synthetase N-terminal domain-containing protein, partial [Alphaproteobacteria bacterium]